MRPPAWRAPQGMPLPSRPGIHGAWAAGPAPPGAPEPHRVSAPRERSRARWTRRPRQWAASYSHSLPRTQATAAVQGAAYSGREISGALTKQPKPGATESRDQRRARVSARHPKYTGTPVRMIPKVTPVFTGSVHSAFTTIPTDASRKRIGTTG